MILGKENKDIKNVVLFNNKKYIESLSGILILSILFYGFQSVTFQSRECWSCKYLCPTVNLY